jgi:pentatricopeptide repeat protein
MVSENVKLRQDPNIHPQILINQLMEYHESSTSTPTLTPRLLLPNTQSYAMVIDGASSFVDGAVVADRLVDWIIDQAPNHPHMQPNVFTFSSLMRAWVKSKDTEAPHRVEDILDLMHHLHLEFPEWDVAPNQVIYATAIDAWAKWGRVDRAEQLLQDMHTAYKEVGMEWLKPNLPAFNGLLVALAKAGEMDRAQQVLEQMEALYESGELDEAPSVISYSTVLDAFAKSSKLGSARRAEKILRQMKDRGVQANSISWNIVINAYAKEKDAERAESLLREMNDEYEKGRNEVKPNMRSYGVVLSAWATMKSPQSGERAEQLLDLMLKLHESGELDEPDVVVYNSVLACWANSRIPGGGIRAKQFLEKFIREGKMKPDSYSFNTVMSALVREGRLGDAESILDLMKENKFSPDATAYNTLLHAWIKSDAKNARARVEELYQRMKEDPGAKADLFTMNILLHFYSKSNNPEAAEALLREMCSPESSIKPDSISFNTALSAWTSSRRPESAERAEAILTQMLEDGERVVPNVVTFNSVLNAWVKSRPLEALNECKRLVGIMFDQVELGNVDAHPDIITYNTLINAHGVSGDDDAPQQAEIIFRELDRRYKEGDDRLKPSIHTYGSLINAWSKSKNPQAGQKAEEILRLWIDRALTGEVSDGPTRMNFTATMRAYTGSGDPLAAHRADAILFLCLREYKNGKQSCKPDNWVFVAALEALVASNVPNKMVAAQRLVELMKDYQIQPDRQKIELLKRCAA